MKKILLILLFYVSSSFAVIPVIDTTKIADDTLTVSNYLENLHSYLQEITSAADVVQQISALKSLQDAENFALNGCTKNCKVEDLHNLTAAIDNINNDLCKQVKMTIKTVNGINKTITSISQLLNVITNLNPKTAELALKRAALQAQMAMNDMLMQMQAFQAQATQKALFKEKVESEANDELSKGMASAAL